MKFVPGCCCGREILILCHTQGTTSAGEGSVSRLDPLNGAVLWTRDLGADEETERPRLARRAAIDSTGKIYVSWAAFPEFSVGDEGFVAAGVVKFDADGNELDSIRFPGAHADFITIPTLDRSVSRVRVDPNDDDRIYYGGDYDEDGFWLYRLNANLEIQWSIGPAETDSSAKGRCAGLDIASDGSLFASLTQNGRIYHIDADGTLLGSQVNASLPDPQGLVWTGTRLVAGGRADNPIGDGFIAGFLTDFSGIDWGHLLDDYEIPFSTGEWIALSYGIGSGIYDGTVLFGLYEPAQWDPDSEDEPEVLYASLLRTSAVGNALDARGWGAWQAGHSSYVYDMAYNPARAMTYVAGLAAESAESPVDHIVGQLGGWTARICDEAGRVGVGIALRVI